MIDNKVLKILPLGTKVIKHETFDDFETLNYSYSYYYFTGYLITKMKYSTVWMTLPNGKQAFSRAEYNIEWALRYRKAWTKYNEHL